jgi:hypothetical protein
MNERVTGLCLVKPLLHLALVLEGLLVLLRLQPPRVYLSLRPRHRLHAVQRFLSLPLHGGPLNQRHQSGHPSFPLRSPCLDADRCQMIAVTVTNEKEAN